MTPATPSPPTPNTVETPATGVGLPEQATDGTRRRLTADQRASLAAGLDALRRDTLAESAPLTEHQRRATDTIASTTAPDTMAPDTMAPDTMAPDTMAPDTMAPDTMASTIATSATTTSTTTTSATEESDVGTASAGSATPTVGGIATEADGLSPSPLVETSAAASLETATPAPAEAEVEKVEAKASPAKRRLRRKQGGVAPYVKPPSRFARYRTRAGWRRRGFVPLSPARDKRRHRILPRTVIGISSMLMMLGIGAAFSGAAFYAYYDDRLANNEAEVARFVEGFDEQFDDAAGSLDRLREDSIDQIRSELLPLETYVADANGVVTLPQTAGASIWRVETTNDNGAEEIGTAFAVTGQNGGTALVTSLPLVRAATIDPAPAIRLVKGETVHAATLWTWDEENGVAVLVTDAVIPPLQIASRAERTAAIGRSVFPMSGEGSQGALASPGQLLDASPAGLRHTAAVAPEFSGGPILDAEGRVLGYSVVTPSDARIISAVDADALCVTVLRCPETGEDVVIAEPEE